MVATILRVNENKQTEYINEGNSSWECMEIRNKCNSMIQTMREDWAWRDMQCGNQILSQWHK